jgi:lysine-specific demethylase/histidyl-hydroxylase NO66
VRPQARTSKVPRTAAPRPVSTTVARTAVPTSVRKAPPMAVLPPVSMTEVRTAVPTPVRKAPPTAVLPPVSTTAVPTVLRTMAASDLAALGATGSLPEGGAQRPALRRCTAVAPELFAASVWGRQASLTRAADLESDFADLFSLDAADALLSRQGLRTPFLRVAKDGSTLPAARYTTGGGVGAGITDQVSDVRLTRLFAEGASIVLQALHRTHPPVIDFAQALGAELGHPVQVNAYLTPPQSQGFSAHYDVHDVFVLQVSGTKRWRIHPPVHPAPLRDQPWTDHRAAVEAAAREDPLIDAELRPGDVLYLPRGFLHAATALGETTAHLTVGVHVWTRRHLLEQLLAAAQDDEELRASLPLGIDVTDPAELRAELARTVERFGSVLPGIDPDQIAAGMVGPVLGAGKAAPVGPLAQAAAADQVGPQTRLRWRPALRVVVRRSGEQIVVRTPDGEVRLPAEAEPGLDRLRAGAVLAVADLGVLDALDLARTLLRDCLVVPA